MFTYVLLQALREADVRFGNRDGYTGLFELVQYVLDGVPKISWKAFGYKQDALVSLLSSTNFSLGVTTAERP